MKASSMFWPVGFVVLSLLVSLWACNSPVDITLVEGESAPINIELHDGVSRKCGDIVRK